MGQATLDIVRAAWDAYIVGDLDAVVEHFAPDIEVDLTNFEGWPEDDVYYGHAGFRRFIGEWLGAFDRYETGVDEFIDATPDRIVALSWQRAHGAGSHVPVEMRLAQIITVRNDKVVRLELWSDRQAARLEALGR